MVDQSTFWLCKHVNNSKTRKIEPGPVKSKIIVRAFEEFATGKHTFGSLAKFLADFGITTKTGTPLAKTSIQRILTSQSYLGLVKYKFEAVQKVLKQRARPRKTRAGHNFPFTGLLTCGECGCAITTQWATRKCGGRYRYYRCAKKKGNCSQRYIQERELALRFKDQLQKVGICNEWMEKFLKKVDEWEKEENCSSQNFIQNLERKIREN